MPQEQLDFKITYLSSDRPADVFRNIRSDASDDEIYETARAFVTLRDLSGTGGYYVFKVISKDLYTSDQEDGEVV